MRYREDEKGGGRNRIHAGIAGGCGGELDSAWTACHEHKCLVRLTDWRWPLLLVPAAVFLSNAAKQAGAAANHLNCADCLCAKLHRVQVLHELFAVLDGADVLQHRDEIAASALV